MKWHKYQVPITDILDKGLSLRRPDKRDRSMNQMKENKGYLCSNDD